jgi:glycosyltransferase involved in cell wall biosynthesis
MHICFAVHSNHGAAILDPEYCEEHPVGGSETAVIKMAQFFRHLGIEVTILANQGELPTDIDVFIAVRAVNLFERGLRPGKLNYLWCQDDIDQPIVEKLTTPEVAHRVYGICDGLIMVSHYQAARWMAAFAAPAEKLFVSSNGIDLPRFEAGRRPIAGREPHAYYASTPFRGLAQLLEFWPIVRSVVGPRARLKICSSLRVYGGEEKPEYQALYDQARSLEGVDYLGSVGQRQLREVAASCRALAYPCVFAETACIAAMEAMASGCVVVATALGALPETAWRNPLVPLGQGWGDLWIEQLLRVLVDDRYYAMLAAGNLKIAELMGWQGVAEKWLMRFQSDRVKRAAADASAPSS